MRAGGGPQRRREGLGLGRRLDAELRAQHRAAALVQRECIDAKEASQKDPPSEPQVFIGEGMKDVPLPVAR